ncbi:MAG: hypothetical protein AAGH15_20865 [Myxococcota bacterium]
MSDTVTKNPTTMNTTMRRLALLLTLAAAFTGVDAGLAAPKAHAQELQVTGPLAGAPAIRRMRLYREGRVRLTPQFAFTLQDDYQRTMLVGLQAGYHFKDWIGVSGLFSYGVAGIENNLTDEITAVGVTTDANRLSMPTNEDFPNQIADLQYVAALQADFIPLRGKIALFQRLFLNADFHIFLGVAFAGVEERANIRVENNVGLGATPTNGVCNSPTNANNTPQERSDAISCLESSQNARSSRIAIAPTFGAGITLYANDFLGIDLSWRGMPFAWNTSGTDESGDPRGNFPDDAIDEDDRFFTLVHMFSVGVAVHLPIQPTVTE